MSCRTINPRRQLLPPTRQKTPLPKIHRRQKGGNHRGIAPTDLKIYWQLLDGEKYPILIFYEDAIAPTQGFSQTFLDALTRFDATICLITDSSHPIIPTLSTQHPHPIQSILTWLQRTL